MSFRVRVQNFQSIKDQTLEIDGLTVITGTNNSGKTAVMRAIRGVFTNAPAGSLVRHGCAHLTVTLTFDDGTEIKWEKGWEKPGQRGKTINQYTINGKKIATVGRGAPPEVEALGVRQVQAASDHVWPQIADQFGGTLFLIDRPGSAVAEALSDVEKVGKLTAALKASEKDRRSVNAELKVRRKDVESHQQEISRYDGLDPVAERIKNLQADHDRLDERHQDLQKTRRLHGQHVQVQQDVASLEGFDPTVVPSGGQVERIKKALQVVGQYKIAYEEAEKKMNHYAGFGDQTLPDTQLVVALQGQTSVLRSLVERQRQAAAEVDFYRAAPDQMIPDSVKLGKIKTLRAQVKAFMHSLEQSRGAVQKAQEDQDQKQAELVRVQEEVKTLLDDLGMCPTCNTVHEGGHDEQSHRV